MIAIKSPREIELMRETCSLAAKTLEYVSKFIEIGISTEELNNIAHEYIVKNGARPSPLNYNGFPKSICTSINEVICHGIPSKKDILKNGDIINIDITTNLNGFHGDTNATYFVGDVKPEVKKLVETTQEALFIGINEIRPGNHIGDIGAVIEEFINIKGFSVVREYCGHGIGSKFHEDPQVPHFGKRGTGAKIKPGMIFTVEPMINLGKRHSKVLSDGWTVVTVDGSYSAQFEHTCLVTDSGVEILTKI